jgi:hypothetical protein
MSAYTTKTRANMLITIVMYDSTPPTSHSASTMTSSSVVPALNRGSASFHFVCEVIVLEVEIRLPSYVFNIIVCRKLASLNFGCWTLTAVLASRPITATVLPANASRWPDTFVSSSFEPRGGERGCKLTSL